MPARLELDARELAFELVRLESFAAKPSRLRCVWLIPHDEELLSLWCATVPPGQCHAFEVEATGRFHAGGSKHLKPVCFSGDELREHARLYWSEQVEARAEQVEILCEGEVKILRELKLAGTTETAWAKRSI